MEINKLSSFNAKAIQSCESLFTFSSFVGEIEYLDAERPELFPMYERRLTFREKWFQLEILNACALSDWEECGSPKDYSDEWNNKFKDDAISLISDMLEIFFCENA